MTRTLASVQRVKAITAIENSDNLETAWIQGWPVVVRKQQFQEHDLVAYFEIDSLLPLLPCFEFLSGRCLRKTSDGDKYLLRTVKLRGQLSQGLVMPLDDFSEQLKFSYAIAEDFDLTELLGITKYERFDDAGNSITIGELPWFLSKTDETRVQNLRNYKETVDSWFDWYATEKLEGSSMQVGLHGGEFFVCSRNVNLAEHSGCAFWSVARKLDLEAKMRAMYLDNVAIQGELIGPKIQGNIYGLTATEFRPYGATDLGVGRKVSLYGLQELCAKLGLDMVPAVEMNGLPDDVETLLKFSDGPSALNSAVLREGLVIRSAADTETSFKAISNAYLLKQK